MKIQRENGGQWFKSTYSGGGPSCVEVRFGRDGVGVRDSKNADGPVFTFSGPAWRAFLARGRA